MIESQFENGQMTLESFAVENVGKHMNETWNAQFIHHRQPHLHGPDEMGRDPDQGHDQSGITLVKSKVKIRNMAITCYPKSHRKAPNENP